MSEKGFWGRIMSKVLTRELQKGEKFSWPLGNSMPNIFWNINMKLD